MSELFIIENKDGTFRLEADVSSRCCGESRYEGVTVRDKMQLLDAKKLVDSGVASWRSGAPKCPTCGQELLK